MGTLKERPLRVLLVEDNKTDYLLTRTMLSRVSGTKYVLEWCRNYEAALERIDAGQHDVYLFDHRLGERTGLDLLRQVVGAGCSTPIVLLTVDSNPELDRKAMEAGAADYLVKGRIDSSHLERVIRYSIERKRIEQELVRAKEEAQAAVRTKSEFMANISHELRTPLNGVFGMTNVLLQTELAPNQRYCVDTIRTSCDGLLFVIDDLLDFSRLDAGAIDLRNAVFKPASFLEGVMGSFEPQATSKGLDLSYSVDAGVPEYVSGDPNRLAQILINLISNGLKFTDRGSVAIALKSQKEAAQEIELLFSVRDTGIGISPQDVDKVFDAFSQVDASPTRRFGGVGLGLAISRRLVHLMGGDIWVESQEGAGSTVSFTIQASIAGASGYETGREVKPNTRLDRDFARRFPFRILVVEDNAVNQAVMQYTLAALGYRPDLSASGPQALDAMGAERYDIVLLDLHMPEMDGFEVMRRIHDKFARSKRPSVIAVTASTTEEVRQSCLALGMTGYLSKPIIVEELARALRRSDSGSSEDTETGPVGPGQKILESLADPLDPRGEGGAATKSVDTTILDRLRRLGARGGTDLLADLIKSFKKRVPVALSELRQAAARGDASAIEEKAHTLKGTAANLGAAQLSRLCGRLEKAGEAGATHEAGELLEDIEEEHARVLAALDEEVG